MSKFNFWTTTYFLDYAGKVLSYTMFWIVSLNRQLPFVATIGPFALTSLIVIVYQMLRKKEKEHTQPSNSSEDQEVSLLFVRLTSILGL